MAAITAILDFRLERFHLFLIYKSPDASYPSFESTGLSVQEKKRKMAAILDFRSLRFTSLRCFLPSFDSIVSVQENKGKLDFQDGRQVLSQLAFWFRRRSEYRFSRWLPWRPSWISDRNDLAIFDLQVTPMPPTKFRLNWPFGSGEEAKNRFSKWPPWWPSWFPIGTIFTFLSTSHPYASYQVSSQLAFWFRRSEK